MSKKPFFSIILCTRNRPELVENILFSFINQSFKDFEVILSDNSDSHFREKNFLASQKYYFPGLKYIQTNAPLNMHDHYNFALEHVSGEYVGVLTDKSLLRKDALQRLGFILQKENFDILNYQHTGCLWSPNNFWKWISQSDKNLVESKLEVFCPKDELKRRFSFKYNRAHSGKYYNFGKLFFGFYHESLIQNVKKKYGKLFHHFSPDYNSAVLALSLSKKAAYCPHKIVFAINNYMGNGAKGATQPGALEEFLKSCGVDFENIITQLPIPNVYALHNLCAYDYEILNRMGCNEYQLDLNNLAARVSEDLKSFPYKSQDERIRLESSLNAFCLERNINLPIKEGSDSVVKKTFIDSLIRFSKQEKKFQKIKGKIFTHHRSLSSLLDL